jgi:hypothetical protein
MAKKRKEIYSKAIAIWGRTSQVLQCAEEASELAVAAIKVANRGADPMGNLAEECADMSIMLHEMKELFGPEFVAQVKKVKAEKLARLERRLDAAS